MLMTPATLDAAAAHAIAPARATALASAMNLHFPDYGLTSPLRIAHFLGQTAFETTGYLYLVELGNAAYFTKYDGRSDLGNTQPGDGFRFRGRGLAMLTGRANYDAYGKQLDLDLIDSPDIAADPEKAVLIACAFWVNHGLNALADFDDFRSITRKINGGENGIADRAIYIARAKRILGVSA